MIHADIKVEALQKLATFPDSSGNDCHTQPHTKFHHSTVARGYIQGHATRTYLSEVERLVELKKNGKIGRDAKVALLVSNGAECGESHTKSFENLSKG